MTSIREIQSAICAEFNITRDALVGRSRKYSIAVPRRIAMARARETGATLSKIGREFGGRHHSTVLHACRVAAHG